MSAVLDRFERAEEWIRSHRRWVRLALWVGVAALAVQVVVFKNQGDLALSHEAVHDFWTGGNVYDADELSPYLYSPLYLLLLSPISGAGQLLGYGVTKALFTAVSMASLAGAIVLLRRILAGSPPERVPGWVLVVPLALSFRMLLNNLQHGQTNLMIFACLLGSFTLLRSGRESWAALCILPAVAIKFVLPLLFVAYFAVRGHLRFVVTLTGLLVVGFVLPALVVGWDDNLALHAQWIRLMPDVASRPEHLENWNNQSALAVALHLFRETSEGPPRIALLAAWVPPLIFGVVTLTMAAISGVAIFFHGGRNAQSENQTELAELSLVLLVMAMTSPLAWMHYFSIWFVPLSLLCLAVARGHPHTPLYVATLVLIGVVVSLPGGTAHASLSRAMLNWGSIFWCNAVVWLCMLDWLRKRPEPAAELSTAPGTEYVSS